MFTGLIQGIGEVLRMSRGGNECGFAFRFYFEDGDLKEGESIAVNGVCLSVEHHDSRSFSAYASAETMSRTNLGNLSTGAKVNLERALALGERLGGHLVSGHVDCLATVREVSPAGQSFRYVFTFPEEFGDQVIPKGSVTLDGISLTVNARGSGFLEVNVIPDTRRRTIAGQWRPGCQVNMETDLIGKYVLGFMRSRMTADDARQGGSERLGLAFLGENGFLRL